MPKALICENNPEITKSISLYLKTIDFDYHIAISIEEALYLLNSDDISFVAINENFGNEPFEKNRVISYLLSLPMYIRRNIFLLLIGQNFKTLDRFKAFSLGVNVVINSKETDILGRVLQLAYAEYNRQYRVFKELLSKHL
ncbi:response regulator [Thermodesulfovibrio hydrogeniphilus]